MQNKIYGRPFGIISAVFFFILAAFNIISLVELSSLALTEGDVQILSIFTTIVQMAVYISVGVFMILGHRNIYVAIALFVHTGILAYASFYNFLISFDNMSIYYLAALAIDVILIVTNLLLGLLAWNEMKPRFERTTVSKPLALVATIGISVYAAICLMFNIYLNIRFYDTGIIDWLLLFVSTAFLLVAYVFLRLWLTARGYGPFKPSKDEQQNINNGFNPQAF